MNIRFILGLAAISVVSIGAFAQEAEIDEADIEMCPKRIYGFHLATKQSPELFDLSEFAKYKDKNVVRLIFRSYAYRMVREDRIHLDEIEVEIDRLQDEKRENANTVAFAFEYNAIARGRTKYLELHSTELDKCVAIAMNANIYG